MDKETAVEALTTEWERLVETRSVDSPAGHIDQLAGAVVRAAGRMDEATAWLLLRCLVALGDEGIGPDDEQPEDDALIAEAARLSGEKIQDYNRWVFEDGREPGWWKS